jgi:hypothetical protein
VQRAALLGLVLSAASMASISSIAGSNTPAPPPADLRVTDAGAELVAGPRHGAIPVAELPAGGKPQVVQDEAGKRFAYATAAGDARLVYAIGDTLWLGGRTKTPVDFHAVPELDDALGAIFEAAGPRRGELVSDVEKTMGDTGVVRMLGESAGTAGKDWDDALAKLPPPRRDEVTAALAKLLDKGKPVAGLERAVARVPLHDAAVLDARVRELAGKRTELGAAAVMLRALVTLDGPRAAAAGCVVLAEKAAPDAPAGHDALAEAALVAIASDAYKGHAPACAREVEAALMVDACEPWFRCAAGQPLSGRETSKQDEALCTKAELEPVVAKDAARPPPTALTEPARPGLFAYAALAAAGAKMPAAFEEAHARRLYAVVQPKTPACDSGVATGTPCHCDEAQLRDLACRNLGTAHTGLCKFEIDDKQKKITNVTEAL